MTNLVSKSQDRIYFVNNQVIYDIKPYFITTDEHAVHIGGGTNENKIDKLYISKGSNKYVYCLDMLIEDGDKYNGTTFTKTDHKFLPEREMALADYYIEICKYEMSMSLANNHWMSYDLFKQNISKLNIPLFMIQGEGYTVKVGKAESSATNLTLINFTKALYDELKDKGIKENIFMTADQTARRYGYVVNTIDTTKQ